MLDVLRGELEREFDVEGIRRLATRYLGLDPDGLRATTPAELAASVVEQCHLLDSLDALADVMAVERPALARRLSESSRRARPPGEALASGTTLGPYTIETALGAGPWASVYLARSGDRKVRLRLLREGAGSSRVALNRYLTHTRLVGDVADRWLPGDVRVELIGDRRVVTHDVFDGELLSERDPQPLSLRRAWPIMRRVLQGLAALHSRGLAHGALHARNIAVGPDDDTPPVRLLDSGSYHLRAATSPLLLRHGAGSAHLAAWAAPEQLFGEPTSPRSDVYSFGLLCHYLLTGRLPLSPDAPDFAKKKVVSEPDPLGFYAPHAHIPDELEEMVLRLVDSNPLGRPADAGEVLELLTAVISSSPMTPSTLPGLDIDRELERLLSEPENEALAGVLEASIERGADPHRIADAFVLAAEHASDGEAGKSARRRLFIRAGAIYENLGADPRAAARAYRRVVDDDPKADGAWTALERVTKRIGDHEKLVELLVERREALSDRPERARVLARLARVLSHDLEDDAEARVALTEALAEDPFNDEHASLLEQLTASERSAWRAVLERLSESANQESDPARKVALSFRLGRWYESGMGRADLALACYHAVVALDPTHERALSRIADIYRRAQQWAELGQALLDRARITLSPAEARDLSTEAAKVFLEHGKNESAAREILEQVLTEDPSHAEAGRLLARLHLGAGRMADWARVMEQRAEGTHGDERRRILAELAHGLSDRMADASAAIAIWEHVLSEHPADVEALRALTDLYRTAGKPAKAVEALETELMVALTPRQRIALLVEIAKIEETELLDEARAADAWERVLDVDADDETALAALARLYRKLRRWSDLAFTLERQSERLDDPASRFAALAALGHVAWTELDDPARALAAFESALALDPTNREVLDARARLSALRGDAESAALTLDALAEADTERERRAEHWLEAAELWLRQGDSAAAVERCRRALDDRPGYPAAALCMANVLIADGEVNAAVTALEHALGAATPGRDKAELSAALARVLLDVQKDPGRARAAVTVALNQDAQNALAHLVAGELDRAHARPAEAAQHYDAASLHLERFSEAEQVRLLSAHALVLSELGRPADARRRLEQLSERYGDRRDALEAAVRIALGVEPAERALAAVERLLEAHEAHFTLSELAHVLTQKGELCRRLSRWDAGREALERAASSDREAVEPLAALARLERDAGQGELLPTTLERLLSRAVAAKDADACAEAGEIAETVLARKDLAARAYLGAIGVRADDRKILLKLVRLYSDEHDWRPLIQVLMKLAGLTPDRRERARYVQMAALFTETELGEKSEAAELYAVAAKLDPSDEHVVSRLIALRGALGDTASLRQILEQQIARASASQDRERAYRLATALADLDLSNLQVDDAIAVNEAALRLVAGDPEREAVLADLYLTDAKRYLHSAAALHRAAVARDPEGPEAYRRLHQLGLAAERRDTAFCAAQALVALGGASRDEEAFFRASRGKSLIGTNLRISDRDWADHLVHADASPTLSSLLLQIQPVVAKTSKGVSLAELGLDEADALDPAAAEGTLVRAFVSAADLLRLPLPLLFERADSRLAVRLGRGSRAHVVLSSAAAHKAMPERKAAFLAASSLVLLRPGYLLRVLLAPQELKAWTLGALVLAAPKLAVSKELELAVRATREHLRRHLPEELQRRLRGILDQLLEAGGQADLSRWVAGVDRTADRAGLLFSNDLETALGVIRASGDSALSLTAAGRAHSLLEYAVSGEYLRLRNRLHLSIDRLDLTELEADELVPASRA